ncbi:MAG: phage capsid protein [Pseudomonadota bacterium]|nr:phage capsid protein [Pseudomonadota bacterium]
MAVTLAQAKLNAQDDIQAGVIDEFRKSSYLLDNMTFDDAVTPGTNGATLTYGYTRLITQPSAAFRAMNTEYTPQEVTKQRYTVELKPFGGSFQIDRVLAKVGGLADEVALQMSQKIKAARSLFHDAAINGDSAVDANAFDGLKKALTGSSTEIGASATAVQNGLDWTVIDTQAEAFKAMEFLDELVAALAERPTALLGNSKSIARVQQIARWAGYLSQVEDAFGRKVAAFDGIPLVDLGAKPASNNPIIPIESRDLDGAGTNPAISGLTDLYAVNLDLTGFHGVSLAGQPLVNSWLPDFSQAGAVKNGEVEMVAAVALKATKSAAVLRHIKVS